MLNSAILSDCGWWVIYIARDRRSINLNWSLLIWMQFDLSPVKIKLNQSTASRKFLYQIKCENSWLSNIALFDQKIRHYFSICSTTVSTRRNKQPDASSEVADYNRVLPVFSSGNSVILALSKALELSRRIHARLHKDFFLIVWIFAQKQWGKIGQLSNKFRMFRKSTFFLSIFF